MRTLMIGTGLAIGILAVGCVGDLDDLAGDEAFDDESLELAATAGDYFVYRNAIECITAPCPVYTVIAPTGNRFDVASVGIAAEADWTRPYLRRGGVFVHGKVVAGSWYPGSTGPRLRILSGIESARRYMVAHEPGEGYDAVSAEGMEGGIATIDFDRFVPAAIGTAQTLETLASGEWVTFGFIAGEDPSRTLFASKGAAVSSSTFVIGSGIDCVMAPCPIWSLTRADGTSLGNASRIDLACLHLGPADEAAMVQAMQVKGRTLLGMLAEGSWDPGGEGDVLLVARSLD